MNGRQSISIAVLTENQDDVALINGTLRDAGHAAHFHWISQPKKLGETLAAEHVELLILNCDQYTQSIRQVIKERDRFNPELPVIAIKQEADENEIEKAMRSVPVTWFHFISRAAYSQLSHANYARLGLNAH